MGNEKGRAMNNSGNIERLQSWSVVAEAIRKTHMSHAWRNEKMSILSGIMKMNMQHVYDHDARLVADTLHEVLTYLMNGDYLTHCDVKNGLSLFKLICDIQIDLWSAKPVSFAKAAAEELDELPF
jgi:hypothetical protein